MTFISADAWTYGLHSLTTAALDKDRGRGMIGAIQLPHGNKDNCLMGTKTIANLTHKSSTQQSSDVVFLMKEERDAEGGNINELTFRYPRLEKAGART